MHHIVVDLGCGDSGKGAITDRLASKDPLNTITIRYTGGSQAGHNVRIGDLSHVHCSFTSAALGGNRGHMSAFCPLDPYRLVAEATVLEKKNGISTRLYNSIDPLCPLILPFERAWNQNDPARRGQTMGCGIGLAMHRHENTPYRIHAIDLLNPLGFREKMMRIHDWHIANTEPWNPQDIDYIIEQMLALPDHVKLIPTAKVLSSGDNYIFEGAQGVMLDRDHGFFPYVTYGHTTMRNAVALVEMIHNQPRRARIEYVTRSYATRHGEGPMGEGADLDLPDEHNVENPFQGPFRTRELDTRLLAWAMQVNEAYNTHQWESVLNVTCLDRLDASEKIVMAFPRMRIVGWHGACRNAKSSTVL